MLHDGEVVTVVTLLSGLGHNGVEREDKVSSRGHWYGQGQSTEHEVWDQELDLSTRRRVGKGKS